MLQVSVDSLESASNAINGGADEIEICSSLNAGGLTPTSGLVIAVQALVNRLSTTKQPTVHVMIRCRPGDDFMYSEQEMQVMLQDIQIFKEIGIESFVFGALTSNHEVDEINCMKILAMAHIPNVVTFSRAFDHVRETRKAAAILVGLGIQRVITAGQREIVDHGEAQQILEALATRYKDRYELTIIAGGGVNVHNVGMLIKMGCPIVHSACRGALQMPNVDKKFKIGTTDSNGLYFADYNRVLEMKEAIAEVVGDDDSVHDEDEPEPE